jgi:hypothetical protein
MFMVLQGINFSKVTVDYMNIEANYPEDKKKLCLYLDNKGFEQIKTIGVNLVFKRRQSDIREAYKVDNHPPVNNK